MLSNARPRHRHVDALHTYDRLKQKAGCDRQAELVALLQRLYPPTIPGDWNG